MKKRWLLIVTLLSLLFAAIFVACGEEPTKYRITVENAEGGQITCVKEATAGETVTITCTPDDGYVLKEGSLKANDDPVEGNSFVMPEKDVVITAEFVLADYKGTYIYYAYDTERGGGYFFEFIEIGESTLTIGTTIATYAANFDYQIDENVPYEESDYTITATVNGVAWSASIGNGTLFCGAHEYELSKNVTLSGTYTEIPDSSAGYWVRNYTFTDGALIITTDFDGTTETENATYKLFGSFLYIELLDTDKATNRIQYGVLNVHEDYLAYLHNDHYVDADTESKEVDYSVLALYPKREQIALKTNGAYILKEDTFCFSGEKQGDSACYDFLALSNGELALSRHGAYFNKNLHYFNANTMFVSVGNVWRVSYTLTDDSDHEQQIKLTFHVISRDLIILKDSYDSIQKFVFTENSAFTGGYGAEYSNTEWAKVDYYEDGKFGTKKYDTNGSLLETNEQGTYHVYGNLLVCEQNGGETRIGVIEEQPAGSQCDYLYHFKRIAWNDSCGSAGEPAERIWKEQLN